MNIAYSKEISLKFSADIVVVGGGIAGVCAACSAAKQGKSVILIEAFGVLGGNASSGGVGAFCGETQGQGEVFDEIIKRLEEFDAIAPYLPYEKKEARLFNHEILPVVLQEMVLIYNIKLLLHTRFVDCIMKNNKIVDKIIIHGASGLEAIEAKFFIDCSGQCDLVNAAGCETMKGSEANPAQLPMSMMFFVRHVREADISRYPETGFEHFSDMNQLPMTSIWPNGPGSNAIKIKITNGDATDTESLTDAEIRARRKMVSVLRYYQEIEKKPWILDHCSPIIGIREGRRAVGEYILKTDDLRIGRTFPDAVARGVFYLDGHDPTNDKRTYILPVDELKVPPYQIPLRCLIVKEVNNLMVAGRCISAEQLALSSARVMTTCAMTGQAAGIACSAGLNYNCSLNKLDGNEIHNLIKAHGAQLDI